MSVRLRPGDGEVAEGPRRQASLQQVHAPFGGEVPREVGQPIERIPSRLARQLPAIDGEQPAVILEHIAAASLPQPSPQHAGVDRRLDRACEGHAAGAAVLQRS